MQFDVIFSVGSWILVEWRTGRKCETDAFTQIHLLIYMQGGMRKREKCDCETEGGEVRRVEVRWWVDTIIITSDDLISIPDSCKEFLRKKFL